MTLKHILLINSVSSGLASLVLYLMPALMTGIFKTTARAPFIGTGLFLFAFAVMVFIESRRKYLRPPMIRLIILIDGLWVACSSAIIASRPLPVSQSGYFTIGAVALWVALMAYLQYAALKQILARNNRMP